MFYKERKGKRTTMHGKMTAEKRKAGKDEEQVKTRGGIPVLYHHHHHHHHNHHHIYLAILYPSFHIRLLNDDKTHQIQYKN